MKEEKYYEIQSGDCSKYVKHSVSNAFNFSGRASRKEYLISCTAIFVYNFIVTTLSTVLAFASSVSAGTESSGIAIIDTFLIHMSGLFVSLMIPLGSIHILLSFFIVFVSLSVTIRRLHDSNYSGWWFIPILIGLMLCMAGLGILLGLFFAYTGIVIVASSNNLLILLSGILVGIVQYGLLFLILLRKPSDPGENAFGEPVVYEL